MECNTDNSAVQKEIDHLETLRFLKRKGYSFITIRQIMPKLVGVDQKWIAKVLGQPGSLISAHLNTYKHRKQIELQEAIARLLGLPREELFEEDRAEKDKAD